MSNGQDGDAKELDFSWLSDILADDQITDIHVKPYGVFVRRNKRLFKIPSEFFKKEGIDPSTWNRSYMSGYGMDSSLSINDIRIRGHVEESINGFTNATRVLPRRIKTMDELGMPQIFKKFTTQIGGGILIICGTTNSGKTTTLAGIIHEINTTVSKHIAIYEDPVEILHEPIKSIISQYNVSTQNTRNAGEAYAERIRGIKRADVDVAIIGETRDPDAIEAVFDVAESGIFVMTTTHAESVPDLFHKLISVMPSDKKEMVRYQMASLIKGVVYQKLVPSKDGKMALLTEYAIPDMAMKEMIRSKDDKIHQIHGHIRSKEAQKDPGFKSLEKSLSEALSSGKIDQETVESISN